MYSFTLVFNSTYKKIIENHKLETISLIILVICSLIILSINIRLNYKNKSNKFLFSIEIILLYSLFINSLLFIGNDDSFKYLLILLIIPYSLESGTLVGLIISILSGILVFTYSYFFHNGFYLGSCFYENVILTFILICLSLIFGSYRKLELNYINEIQTYAKVDGLTNLFNHRTFQNDFKKLFDNSIKNNTIFSLIIIDIDYFKLYNDILGHQSGDYLLKSISKLLKNSLPTNYNIYRYGGEEFTILLPDTAEDIAFDIAENLRLKVMNYNFSNEYKLPNKKVTISLGVSQLNKDDYTVEKVFFKADSALYKSKNNGRNSVTIYSDNN